MHWGHYGLQPSAIRGEKMLASFQVHCRHEKAYRTITVLLIFLLLDLNICIAQPKSPLEVVKLFDKCYGGPLMDEIADYTTPSFRDNKPKSVWVVETWKTLKDIQYERLNSSVIGSQVKGDKAIVILEANEKSGQVCS